MKRRSSQVLGLAVSERAIMCAQVAADGANRAVKHLGVLALPEAVSFDTPADLGKALAEFLKAHDFDATRAVVGVPARWLIAQEKDVPPVAFEEAKTIVRLQAERMGSAEKGSLVADVAGTLGGAGGTVLVVAMLQKRLDQIKAAADAAGLTLAGVTSTGLSLSNVVQPASHALILLGDRGAELVVRREGTPRLLRHVGVAKATTTASLAPEVRRSLMSSSAGNEPLVMCDTTGGNCDALEQQFGVTAGRPTLETLKTTLGSNSLNGAAAGLEPVSFVPAVALALAEINGTLPVNYLKSRLTPAPVRRFGQRAILGTVVGVLAVAGAIFYYTTVTSAEADARALDKTIADQKPAVTAAEVLIDRVSFGRTFFETRTPVLDALAEVSKAFNYDETIFVSGLTFNSANVGELKGKSSEERYVFALIDRLKANKKLSNVETGDIRESNNKTREFSFSIKFKYAGANATEVKK